MLSRISSFCGGPENSLKFGVILVLVLLLLWIDVRPYGILSLAILFVLLVRIKVYTDCGFMCPKIPSKYMDEIKKFRAEHPGKFCAFSSAAFFSLAILGNIISGTWLVTIGVILIVAIKAKNHLPANMKQAWNKPAWHTNDSEVDDFLPELNEQNLELLNKARSADLKHDSDEESDKKSDAFLLDKTPNFSQSSSDSEDDAPPVDGIEFKSGYFNGDSSNDDDSYVQGLNFKEQQSIEYDISSQATSKSISRVPRDNMQVNLQQTLMSGLMTNVSSMVPWSLVTNIIGASAAVNSNNLQRKKRESDSDSEFELLDNEDLNVT